MSNHFVGTKRHVVIDTEQYAGNFEREMVAFITGLIGECGVGEEAKAYADDELSKEDLAWFDNNVNCWVQDDHGCGRPAFLVETPGWGNDGMGEHTKKQTDNPSKVNKRKTAYPAYLSVGFEVSAWPELFILHTIIRRAQRFCKDFPTISRFGDISKTDALTFTGLRFVEVTTTEKTIKEMEFKQLLEGK